MRKTKTCLALLLAGTLFASCQADANKQKAAENNASTQEMTGQEARTTQQEKSAHKHTVVSLDKKTFLQKIFDYEASKTWKYKGERPAVIDLYADWCGPCKRIAPILQELAEEYTGKVDFYKINVDDEAELAALFNVSSIPLVLFIPTEGEVLPLVGAADKATYRQAINDVLLKH